MKRAYHWVTATAPSIQLVELKNMPWLCKEVGSSNPLVTWMRSESEVFTEMGGGLLGLNERLLGAPIAVVKQTLTARCH